MILYYDHFNCYCYLTSIYKLDTIQLIITKHTHTHEYFFGLRQKYCLLLICDMTVILAFSINSSEHKFAINLQIFS